MNTGEVWRKGYCAASAPLSFVTGRFYEDNTIIYNFIN